MMKGTVTPTETMIVAASRFLKDGVTCFVGIGAPSAAANLARLTHAPGLVLVYESGCIGSKPSRLPLSIGDGDLATTADSVVPVPEMFNYWLQPGRIDIGFLGAAQIDRRANINTTVIGDYASPTVRLPGAGGAPEIAACCRTVIVIVRHDRRTLVETLDFRSSVGFGEGPGFRQHMGLLGAGPSVVVTDLGVLEPDPETCELILTRIHPAVKIDDVLAATGWDLAVSADLEVSDPPSTSEIATLRELQALR